MRVVFFAAIAGPVAGCAGSAWQKSSALAGTSGDLKGSVKAGFQSSLQAAGNQALAEAKGQLHDRAKRLGGEALAVGAEALASAATQALVQTEKTKSPEVRANTQAVATDKTVAAGPGICTAEAEPAPDHDIAALTRSLLLRSSAHAVASARLCEYRARRVAAGDDIRHERAARKYSGVLDQERLHAAGRIMAEMDTSIERLESRIEQQFGTPALPCSGGLALAASCMAETSSCRAEVEDVRDTWPLVESQLLGVVVPPRDAQLEAKIGPMYTNFARGRAQAAAEFLGQHGAERQVDLRGHRPARAHAARDK